MLCIVLFICSLLARRIGTPTPAVASCTLLKVHQIAGRSGLVVARLPAAQKIPGSNRATDQEFVFSQKSLRYAALGTGYTLTAVPRSTQPSTLPATVNEYQPHG